MKNTTTAGKNNRAARRARAQQERMDARRTRQFDYKDGNDVETLAIKAAKGKNQYKFREYGTPAAFANMMSARGIDYRIENHGGDVAATFADTVTRMDKVYGERERKEEFVTETGLTVKMPTGEYSFFEQERENVTGDTIPDVMDDAHAGVLGVLSYARQRIIAREIMPARKYRTLSATHKYHATKKRAAKYQIALMRTLREMRAAGDKKAILYKLANRQIDKYARQFDNRTNHHAKTPDGSLTKGTGNHDKSAPDARAIEREIISIDALREYMPDAHPLEYDNAAADVPTETPVLNIAAADDYFSNENPAADLLAFIESVPMTANRAAACRAEIMLRGVPAGGRGTWVTPIEIARFWIDNPSVAPAYVKNIAAAWGDDRQQIEKRVRQRIQEDFRQLSKNRRLAQYLKDFSNARAGTDAPAWEDYAERKAADNNRAAKVDAQRISDAVAALTDKEPRITHRDIIAKRAASRILAAKIDAPADVMDADKKAAKAGDKFAAARLENHVAETAWTHTPTPRKKSHKKAARIDKRADVTVDVHEAERAVERARKLWELEKDNLAAAEIKLAEIMARGLVTKYAAAERDRRKAAERDAYKKYRTALAAV